jgi:hypothetical protein
MKWFLRLAAFCLGLGIALPAFAAVQAAINAASAAGVPLHFDMVHKYLITSPLKVTAPIDIEGQYRYGI